MLEYLLGFHTTHAAAGAYADYGVYVILAGGLAAALRGIPSAAGRLTTGITGGVAAAVTGAAILGCYLAFVNPSYVDVAIAAQRDRLAAAGVPDEILVQQVNGMRLSMGPRARIIGHLLLSLCIAAAVPAAAAAMKASAPAKGPPRGRAAPP